MKTVAIIFGAAMAVLLLDAAYAGEDIPLLPDTFVRIGRVDESGKTWRESGQMRMALSNAVETLKTSIASQGYAFTHDIADSPDSPRRILFWTGLENDIIAMLWRIDDATTGVRWGLSAHGRKSSWKPADSVQTSTSRAQSAGADGASSHKNKTQKE